MSEEIFQGIYFRYCNLVMKIAGAILKDYSLAQDVCQDVFVCFFEKSGKISEKYYRAWFQVTTKRKAIDYSRKSYARHEQNDSFDSDETFPTSGKGEDDEVINENMQKDLAKKLFKELREYNKDWYELVMRVIIDEQEPADAARELGISIECLRTKLHRARAWIRKSFQEDFDELD